MFDAATAEEARRRRAEEMGERWRAEREHLRMEQELQFRERREALEHQRREVLEQQLLEEAAWATEAEADAEVDAFAEAVAAQMEEEDGAEAVEEVNYDDDFDWSDDDGPEPDEAVDQQRALVESFESQKKLQDDARARED